MIILPLYYNREIIKSQEGFLIFRKMNVSFFIFFDTFRLLDHQTEHTVVVFATVLFVPVFFDRFGINTFKILNQIFAFGKCGKLLNSFKSLQFFFSSEDVYIETSNLGVVGSTDADLIIINKRGELVEMFIRMGKDTVQSATA